MGFGDVLGRLAKDWAGAKASELLTADAGTRADAAARADAAEDAARVAVGEQAVRSALPGLAAYADRQAAERVQREAAAVAEEQAELGALPRGEVTLHLTGAYDWQWTGVLPLRWDVEDDALTVELLPLAEDRPRLGEHGLTRVALVVPGYTGDGTYDLAALYLARAAAGRDDYLDWGVELDEGGDWSAYFYPQGGPSSVTVGDDGARVSAVLSCSGAVGAVSVVLEVKRAPAAA